MSPLAVAVVSVVAVTALVVVVTLVRSHRLKERYAIIWILLAGGMVVLVVLRPVLDRISTWLGFQSGVSTLFLLSTLVILAVLLQISVSLTALQEKVRDLAEAHALHVAEGSEPVEDRHHGDG